MQKLRQDGIDVAPDAVMLLQKRGIAKQES